MTNDLCYSSATSTRAMSICIPLYYANLISQRARWSLEEYLIPKPDPTDKTKYTVRISDWNGLDEKYVFLSELSGVTYRVLTLTFT